MTPVTFEFNWPDGSPLADAEFTVTTRRAGFIDPVDGITLPDEVTGTLDAEGKATLLLQPSSALYYLVLRTKPEDPLEDPCGATGVVNYKFYVPDSVLPVRAQDIIMDPPPSTKAWDEAAMLLILDAKVHSAQSAAAALASEQAAAISEDNAAQSAAAAATSEQNAGNSEQAAAGSALSALNSENAASASELAAGASAIASQNSALAAQASADFAAGAVQDMQDQVDEATLQASNAATSADNAASSELAASGSADQAAADALTTTADRGVVAADKAIVTGLKADVITLKDDTEGFRDETAAMVGSLGAIIVDGGPVDLSAGAYPAAPTKSTMWKVTVGGTVSGAPGDTYGVGDTLMYAHAQSLFYKIDNTENVSSVAGKTGVVTLVKADVGLSNVDNTSDANKPVSTAQAAVNTSLTDADTALGTQITSGLALKVDKTSIVDDLTSTDATKVLSAKQGKALKDQADTDRAAVLTNHYTKTESNTLELSGFPAVTLASAATTSIGTQSSEVVNISGTTAITSFGAGTDGMRKRLRFSGALVLTHNAVSLILLGTANIATAAGDSCEMLCLGGSNWIMLSYARADGRPLAFAYDRTNAVGSVGDTGGGVPNGAIIETGVLSGTRYIKFLDGTLIQYRSATIGGGTAANGGVFKSVNFDMGPLAIAAVGDWVVVPYGISSASGGGWAGQQTFGSATQWGQWAAYTASLVSGSMIISLIGIGRWKA